jgi:Saxitoxin biosynthesis operon protein SxtJ
MKVTELSFFQHVRWQPDREELRRFAISMFVGFAVIGLIVAWRAGQFGDGTFICWGIGVTLAIAAFIPILGRIAYLCVYVPTSIIGYIVSHIVLALIFLLLFVPLGTLLRLMGKDLLQLRAMHGQSKWLRVGQVRDANDYYRQF